MITLLLLTKNQSTKDGRKFKKFFTRVKIEVKGEEEKGLQPKTLTVKFADGVKVDKLGRGLITCKEEDIELPYKFQITKNEKTGKDQYSYIYIKGYDNFEPRKPKSTVQFDLLDEDETEEIEILDEEE